MNNLGLVFKIRCSAIGLIMADNKNASITEKQLIELGKLELKEKRTPTQEKNYQKLLSKKEAKPELSEGAKTYCEKWLKETYFKRRKHIETKGMTKGIVGEQSLIDFLNKHKFLTNAIKNEEFKENGFSTGTCDINYVDRIIDLKNSEDLFTFPMFSDENKTSLYEWQGHGYMELWDKDLFELCYVLGNTPEEQIMKELDWKMRDKEFDTMEEAEAFESNIRKQHIFDDIEPKLRKKSFFFKRDKDKMKRVKERVAMCQNYIDELIFKFINKK